MVTRKVTSSDHPDHQAPLSIEDRKAPRSFIPMLWIVSGLAFPPAFLVLFAWIAPFIPLAEGISDLLTFFGATITLCFSLFLLAHGQLPTRVWVFLGSIAAAMLGVLFLMGVQSVGAVVLVGTALITVGHAIGNGVGIRIEDPGHLLPACVVAACVDIASVLHPQGPTHAIVSSERALELLTLSFPVLGTEAFAPSVGVGDIVFSALLLGTASRHGLSIRRVALLIATGLILAGVLSALLATAVPALPTIGFALLIGVPKARKLRPQDRKTASWFMLGAIVLSTAVVVSRYLGP